MSWMPGPASRILSTHTEREQGGRPRPRPTAGGRPFWMGELAIVGVLLVVYDRVRSSADVHASVAVSHGWAILHAETALHLRIEHTLNAWLTAQGLIRSVAVEYYQLMHLGVALSVLVVCYARSPAVYRQARNALVLTNVVGLAVFTFYPVAPPRLLPGAAFVDSVAGAGFGSSHGPIPADQYGALPSLHLAWATWAVFAVFAMTRRLVLRALLVLHLVLTAVVVVATANHYVLDVASGLLLGTVAVALGGVLSATRRPSRARPEAPRSRRTDRNVEDETTTGD